MKRLHRDPELFEALTLEAMAAGLNRKMIQNKKSDYQKVFSKFNIKKVAKISGKQAEKMLSPSSKIIRNKAKILATINNAQKILEIKKEFKSFDKYIWKFVKGKKLTYGKKENRAVAIAMSKDLKKRGFKFTGPSTCYVFIHAIGMVYIPKGTVRKKAPDLP